MVPFTTTRDPFEARVMAARLGANGVLCQLRGDGLDPSYPLGNVDVLVAEDDLSVARELLLGDEVEAVFDGDRPRMGRRRLVLVAVALLIVVFAVMRALENLFLA